MDSSTTTSTTTSTSTSTHGLKRKSRRERWEDNKRKTRGDRGKGYVAANYSVVPRKKFKEIPHCCGDDCYSKIPRGLQKELFNNFYSMGSKEKQDTCLMRCIHRQSLKQIKQNVKTKNRECSWKYSLQDNGVN